MSGPSLLLVSLVYLALLFVVAALGDRGRFRLSPAMQARAYGLTLAVYCSSWTFYGAVGSAAREFWRFLPIYLGPMLLLLFAPVILQRLIDVGRQRGVTSIADMIATRFGRSAGLAALISLIALIASLPYLALQLRAVAMSIDALSGGGQRPDWWMDSALPVAAILAIFAIGFGTREVDAREHHRGLMLAVALESLVKLLAFVLIGLWAATRLFGIPSVEWSGTLDFGLPDGFFAHTVLSFVALFCLPRQFQVAVVECTDSQHFRSARWGLLGYLAIITVLVLPITMLGAVVLPAGVRPDLWMLALPLQSGDSLLALLVYLGGFSAATGMVIVASIALATMVSNHLVVPTMLRLGWFDEGRDLAPAVLWIRRGSILLLAVGAFVFHRLSGAGQGLASIGLLAFAAVAQFAPLILAGLFWRGVSARGAIMGLVGGFAVWCYTLLLPAMAPDLWVDHGPFGIDGLRPRSLLGLSGWEHVSHGSFVSLSANIILLVLGSLRWRPSIHERLHAAAFLGRVERQSGSGTEDMRGRVTVADLRLVSSRILGERQADRLFAEFVAEHGALGEDAIASRPLLQFVERQLAGAIGASSARRVLTTALRGRGLELEEVVSLLDETSQALRFSRELLEATLDNISQGISVVDAEMRLVAWNRRYLELFDYPEGMVYVGRPVADLIRYNAERGECGPGEVDGHVQRRIGHMRQGHPHVFERVRADGRVIEMRGQPMPGGGFATTFADVTDYKRSEEALIESKQYLEDRVEQRTRDLREALDAQQVAKREAERANESKSRFLAAASHDLVQPMNAARLFVSALSTHRFEQAEVEQLVQRIHTSLHNAEELLDGLLEVSRLDSGALRPEPSVFRADEFCDALQTTFAAVAEERGLALRVHCPSLNLHADRVLLRRIVQNLLSNGLRYTRKGGVMLAVRRRGGQAAIQVWDTGPGIPRDQATRIFEEFQRLDPPSPWGEQGLGLGLSICERMARLLGLSLRFQSRPGRGSMFEVCVPLSNEAAASSAAPAPLGEAAQRALHVLCIDDDPGNLEGMTALLGRWGASVDTAISLDEALSRVRARVPDLLLVDYRLGIAEDGFAVIDLLAAEIGRRPTCALVTAENRPELARRARELGVPVLHKPVRPAGLRALVEAAAAQRQRRSRGEVKSDTNPS
ncbi:MAG: PAS domain-containing hybrid sensor histidine kinase/response regulator [Lysobacteraceae bacterium]|nr:hybrid sensor histidine kinase/response regulator [Xanthomonadales bacterium]HPF73566.1 PAS domain-containing hybrid sensor histidine kinase/response regulator [Xanthomonadaceae bacterium]HRX99438.1 PAS domain-containing hybrid sensor histidine kinase/response regulator [Xanthomonadaceae bacterium]